jgi:hypothetical protein
VSHRVAAQRASARSARSEVRSEQSRHEVPIGFAVPCKTFASSARSWQARARDVVGGYSAEPRRSTLPEKPNRDAEGCDGTRAPRDHQPSS